MSLSTKKKRIILLIGTIILFIILSELTLRIINYNPSNELIWVDLTIPNTPIKASEDKILVYEFKKNTSKNWFIEDLNLSIEFKTNSLGMRDYEYSQTKAENSFRILILGDSVTAGSLVAYTNQTYPKKLEKILNEQSKNKIEVLNAGVDGYNTIQESRYFVRKGIELKPDLVIINYVMENDFSESRELASFEKSEKKLEYYNHNIKYFEKPRINKFLVEKVYFMRFMNHEIISSFNIEKGVEELFLGKDDFIKAIDNLKRSAEQNKIKVLFVLIPSLNENTLISEREFVKNILNEQEIAYFDLYNTIRLYDSEKLKADPNDDIHPNEYGYEIIANEVYEFIMNNNLCCE